MFWSIFLIVLGFIIGLIGLIILNFDVYYYLEWGLLENFGVIINYRLFVDWISMFFVSYVFIISGRVIYYRKEYIRSDKGVSFLNLVLIFILSIVLLVMSPNLIRILFGWDGLGAVSYLLIIYYRNNRSYNAGMLTIIINRFGDILLLMRISFLIKEITWDLIFLGGFIDSYLLIFFLLITAGFTKSAQIPFSSWLPAAIAAPTPVSALVHSSTLVTAGVYLLIRYSSLIKECLLFDYIVFLSLLTIVIAGICANYEIDLKKIIALSTLSQLGVIVFIIGLENSLVGYYHMLIHAIFKALLFLSAGGFIHSLINYQDVRLIGGLGNKMFFFSLSFRGCSLSLIGFPFLAGFYSKDLICEYILIGKFNFFLVCLFLLRIGLTRRYRFKALNRVWGGNRKIRFGLIGERGLIINRIFVLMVGAFINGSFISWLMIPEDNVVILPFFIRVISIIIILIGAVTGVYVKFNTYLGSWIIRRMWFIRKLRVQGGLRNWGFRVRENYFTIGDLGWNEHYRKIGVIKIININYILVKYENFILSLYAGGVMFWVIYLVVY